MSADNFTTHKSIQKVLRRLPAFVHKKVIHAFTKIKQNPLSGVRLKGELHNSFKYRVGDYRIIYRFDEKSSTVIILKVEHRQGVYR